MYPYRKVLVVVGGTAAAVAGWAVADPLLGVDLVVGGRRVGPGAVITVSLLAGLLGWAVFALLSRMVRRVRPLWTVLAGAVLLLSLLGPLGADSGAATLALLGMHLAVGLPLILGLPSAPRDSAADRPTDWLPTGR